MIKLLVSKEYYGCVLGVFPRIFATPGIIKSNRQFLQEYLEPDILIKPLISAGCLTMKQSVFIRNISNRGGRSHELLKVIRSDPCEKQRNFIDCLRSTNQQRIADLIEKGGGNMSFAVKFTNKDMDFGN